MSEVANIDRHTEGGTVAQRAVPEIDAKMVKINVDGFLSRQIDVFLPFGFILDDLRHPAIWEKVQGHNGGTSLRVLDEVRLIEFNREWIADATVAGASEHSVSLSAPRVERLPPRQEFLFEDELYRVKFYGAGFGYAVERKKDGQKVTQYSASKVHAERDLRNLYSRPAA